MTNSSPARTLAPGGVRGFVALAHVLAEDYPDEPVTAQVRLWATRSPTFSPHSMWLPLRWVCSEKPLWGERIPTPQEVLSTRLTMLVGGKSRATRQRFARLDDKLALDGAACRWEPKALRRRIYLVLDGCTDSQPPPPQRPTGQFL